jgi:8-oxo-dGTP diphosphatase
MPDASKRSESEFLRDYDPGAFDRPSVSVDVVVLSVVDRVLRIALYERTEHPHLGRFALPGGFVHIDESLSAAAERLLAQKVGLHDVYFDQLRTFGRPDRDPRMRIITVAHFALVEPEALSAATAVPHALLGQLSVGSRGRLSIRDDSGRNLPMAFDHDEIVAAAIVRLAELLESSTIAYALLPKAFTLRELQQVHEAIRGEDLNKDSFRRRLLQSGDLVATGKRQQSVGHRPAELFRARRKRAGRGGS